MKSMTGFGRASAIVGDRRIVVEVRSVNSRGLDIKVRARDLDAAAELEIVKAVRGALERGAVIVTVHEEAGGGGGPPLDQIRALHAKLEALRDELGIPGRVDLATVASFLSAVGAAATSPAGDDAWKALAPAVGAALAALTELRRQEGRALSDDIGRRLAALGGLVDRLQSLCAGLPTRAARRLEERIAALSSEAPVDPGRLAQEVAFLAERLDVSEELARLATHLSHLTTIVRSEGAAVGRKLDFVIQEVGRELNTLGSKAQDAEIGALVIEAKAELEKIREQAQNVE